MFIAKKKLLSLNAICMFWEKLPAKTPQHKYRVVANENEDLSIFLENYQLFTGQKKRNPYIITMYY